MAAALGADAVAADGVAISVAGREEDFAEAKRTSTRRTACRYVMHAGKKAIFDATA